MTAQVRTDTIRWYGVQIGLVTDLRDPDGLGRVKVRLPWAPDAAGGAYEAWARLATLMGGSNRGSWFVPDVDDEVLMAFEGGDPRYPYVLGGLWNGRDKPPQSMDSSGRNSTKVIRSRNGVKLTLDDSDGQERFVVETPGGQKVSLTDGPAGVEIADSAGSTVKLDSAGITLQTGSAVTVKASQVQVTAPIVTVDAGMAKFSGVVKAETILATTVVSSAYTPGAGNIW